MNFEIDLNIRVFKLLSAGTPTRATTLPLISSSSRRLELALIDFIKDIKRQLLVNVPDVPWFKAF